MKTKKKKYIWVIDTYEWKTYTAKMHSQGCVKKRYIHRQKRYNLIKCAHTDR